MLLEAQRHRVAFAEDSTERDEDYRCIACGYGVSGCERLPICPMCHQRAWRRTACASNLRERRQSDDVLTAMSRGAVEGRHRV
jgi:hypothetical protein